HACAFVSCWQAPRAAAMNSNLHFQLSVAALACSVAALFFSLLAAFPGLKAVLLAIRDGVLWFALFLILGGGGFVLWQHLPRHAPPTAASQTKMPSVPPLEPAPTFSR